MKETIDTPPGFDDAPATVQRAVLENEQSADLAEAIADELSMDPPRGQQLNKEHKAAILLRLWDYREMVNESGPNPDE